MGARSRSVLLQPKMKTAGFEITYTLMPMMAPMKGKEDEGLEGKKSGKRKTDIAPPKTEGFMVTVGVGAGRARGGEREEREGKEEIALG